MKTAPSYAEAFHLSRSEKKARPFPAGQNYSTILSPDRDQIKVLQKLQVDISISEAYKVSALFPLLTTGGDMLKRIIVLFLISGIAITNVTFAQRGGSVHVRESTRKGGTSVPPPYRSNPDGNFYNHWSTQGNNNPDTGKERTRVNPLAPHPFTWGWVTPKGEVRPYGNLISPGHHLYWYEYQEEIWPSAGVEDKPAYMMLYKQPVVKPLPPDKLPSPPIVNLPAFAESPFTLFFSDPNEQEITVHINQPGEYYHRASCRLLNSRTITLKLKDAIKQGFSPCKVCRP
jgi:hypothetical protein